MNTPKWNKEYVNYTRPSPRPHRRYASVTSIPLETRLQSKTLTLQCWLHRLQHQQRVTARLFESEGQLTIFQAFANADKLNRSKYPP